MLELYWDDLLHVFLRQVLLSTKLYRSLGNLKASANVAAVHRNFARDEVEALLVNDVVNVEQALLEDDLNLMKVVRLVDQAIVADTRADFLLHSLG